MKGIVHRGLLAVAPVLLGIGCRAERLTQPPSGSVVSSATIGPAAGAQPQGLTITEYPVPSGLPQFITAGPDGNLWFTELFSRIGRITTSGVITEFPVPTAGNPNGITAGPDGNLWFADYGADKIGKITTSGVITEFSVPTPGNPYGITAGPDGNLWFTEFTGHNIGKITTSGVITEFSPPQTNSYTFGITAGPDGNLWFTEAITIVGNPNTYVSKIGRITTIAAMTEFLLPTGADG